MKRILVIEREYGAGGSVIAEQAAQRLGWKLLDHALTEEIARIAKVSPSVCEQRSERVDPWLYRLAKVFWRGSHERSVQFADSDVLDAERLICLTRQVIEEAAATGQCVIVGRCAPYFLRDRADTFRVFLYASREIKFQRVFAEVKDEAKAIDLVDNVDEERVEFVKRYFGAQWPSRQLYDAMLNTGIGEDATVDIILDLMERDEKRETGK
jgi:cytidylate kinase